MLPYSSILSPTPEGLRGFMQPIIHKASIALDVDPISTGISPGDRALLSLDPESTVSVFIQRRSRLPFGFGKTKLVSAGKLSANATDILRPALERKADLRVRIVEVEPAHLSRSGHVAVFISVWGDPADINQPKSALDAVTRSKINESGPSNNDR